MIVGVERKGRTIVFEMSQNCSCALAIAVTDLKLEGQNRSYEAVDSNILRCLFTGATQVRKTSMLLGCMLSVRLR